MINMFVFKSYSLMLKIAVLSGYIITRHGMYNKQRSSKRKRDTQKEKVFLDVTTSSNGEHDITIEIEGVAPAEATTLS